MKRSMLFCPSKNEEMMIKAEKYNPDCIIFDLEDSITPDMKEQARDTLISVMKKHTFTPTIYARVNGVHTPFFEKDIEAIVKAGIKHIRIAMCERPEDIKIADEFIVRYETKLSLPHNTISIQCSIETPLGVYNAFDIGKASKRNESLSFGSEDYTNGLGVNRTKNTDQLLYARSHLALCANILNLDMIDSVYTDLNDLEGLENETRHVQTLGFTGKSCVHPKQIEIINKCFTPSAEEIEYAKAVIEASENAKKSGIGVIQLNGKMIDGPIISKAYKIIKSGGKNV